MKALPPPPEEHGKIPPQAIDLEEVVLGALMIFDCLINVKDFMKPEVFYKDAHQKIYAAIQRLDSKNEKIDILTVTNELKNKGKLEVVGGPFYVTQLTNRIVSGANIEEHARIVYQKFIQRELIRISSETIKEAFEDMTDVFELLNTTQAKFGDLHNIHGGDIQHIIETVGEVMETVNENALKDELISGIPTGFHAYDYFNKGDQPGLTVIGARPSQGKTAYLIQKSVHQAQTKKVAIITYEMSAKALAARCMSLTTDIPYKELLFTKLKTEEIQQIHGNISKLIDSELYICSPLSPDLKSLKSLVSVLVHKFGIEVIGIDYLQKITCESSENIRVLTKNVVNSISLMAQNIPITLISELKRTGKKPVITDLMESSAIEYAADIVLLMWQPQLYGVEEIEIKLTNEIIGSKGLVQVLQEKGRNTGTTKFLYNFTGENMKFVEYNVLSADKLPF